MKTIYKFCGKWRSAEGRLLPTGRKNVESGMRNVCCRVFYLLLTSFSPLLLFTSCIDEYEADISAEDSNLLVVEGTICSAELNKFYLSRTQDIKATHAPRMVTGASVSVHGSDGSEYKAQATDDYYACWIDQLEPDVKYYLHIEADGEVYESEPQLPIRTEKIASVVGAQDTPDRHIDVLVTPDAPFDASKTNYYTWSYIETWEVHPEYTTYVYFDTNTMQKVDSMGIFPERGWRNALGTNILVEASTHYEDQHIQRIKLYDFDNGDERLFFKYSGLVQQRAISKEEYEYECARRQASSEMGGLFTPLPSALPTNIHCLTSRKSVIGFVGCALNTAKYRFFFDSRDFIVSRTYKGDTRVWLHDFTIDECLRMARQGMYLCEWDDNRMNGGGPLNTAWATKYQLDVRERGAYTEEPDFWSLDEDVSY